MSSLLRDTNLIEFCTQSIDYDNQVKAACSAFDPQLVEIIDDTGAVIFIPNIMGLTDSNLVDILAWQFHVDFYDKTKPLSFRKNLVQMSIIWHATKGTRALVQEVLDTYFPFGATLQEWFEYMSPFPPNYPIDNPDAMLWTFTPADVNTGSNMITHNAHGLANGTQLRFVALVSPTLRTAEPGEPLPLLGEQLPAPLQEGIWYFVSGATTNNFKLSLTNGGAVIDLTTTGIGTFQTWRRGTGTWHDRYKFRVLIDDAIISPDDEAQALALINAYKPVSRWCDGFVRADASSFTIGLAVAMLRFVYRTTERPLNYP